MPDDPWAEDNELNPPVARSGKGVLRHSDPSGPTPAGQQQDERPRKRKDQDRTDG